MEENQRQLVFTLYCSLLSPSCLLPSSYVPQSHSFSVSFGCYLESPFHEKHTAFAIRDFPWNLARDVTCLHTLLLAVQRLDWQKASFTFLRPGRLCGFQLSLSWNVFGGFILEINIPVLLTRVCLPFPGTSYRQKTVLGCYLTLALTLLKCLVCLQMADLQQEHQREIEGLLENIRQLSRELRLQMLIIDNFIPQDYQVKMQTLSP